MPPRSGVTTTVSSTHSAYNVILSAHAQQRLIERADTATARGARTEIAIRLTSALRLGTVPNNDLGVMVRMRDGYIAVCYPSLQGGWVVATVLPPVERATMTGEVEGCEGEQKGVSVE